MRVIFGGTFDPVHIGHLRMASELVSELGVRCIHLMPCYKAVHKDSVSASANDRIEMLRLATSDDNCLSVDDREVRRGRESYTVDSLRDIRQEISEQPLSIVMGTDSALGLDSWRDVEVFSTLTHIVVVRRPGETKDSQSLVRQGLRELGFEMVESPHALHQKSSGLAIMLELTQLDVSSTYIRSCVKENKSIRYLVKGAVESYICDNRLYQS
jgi:nicotinate-nucleotide adenylyltransferase